MTQAPTEAALPKGFRFSATACGLKKTGALDLAILSSDVPASAAAVFTQNLVVAAPVTVSKKHLAASKGRMRAVVVNAGNANCATGGQGDLASLRTVEETSKRLGLPPQEVFVCSTGVIGVQLPVEKILRALPMLAHNRRASARSFAELSLAICTTDTRPKTASASFRMSGKRIHLIGCAKGAGMIHPNMATTLAFVATDANISPSKTESAAKKIAETIATSPLVKTAFAGGDPNWGRIFAAAGRSGVKFDPSLVEITMAGIKVLKRGHPLDFNERAASNKLLADHVPILVNLHAGKSVARYWTCDFTAEYVRINASYRT